MIQLSKLTPNELLVLESQYPAKVGIDMRSIGCCLYEALLLGDARLGTKYPDKEWLGKLQETADIVLLQLQHLSSELGGLNAYITKELSHHASQKYKTIYSEFTGFNHNELAKKYDLTTVRIYQIISAVRLEEFKSRQQNLHLE